MNLIRSLILESDWLHNSFWDLSVLDVPVRLILIELQLHIVLLEFVDLLILAVNMMAIVDVWLGFDYSSWSVLIGWPVLSYVSVLVHEFQLTRLDSSILALKFSPDFFFLVTSPWP